MPRYVFLTGGNGFIGSHILAELLNNDFYVSCAVRTQAKGDKILEDFAAQKSQIDISVIPDIISPDAYNAALKRHPFEAVFHTASQFSSNAEGDKYQLYLKPAIEGTLNLLRTVKDHAPSVRRVIWTGSCASVIDYGDLVSVDHPRVYDEKDWNPITLEDVKQGSPSQAYIASKKFAEQGAWAFMEQEKPHFELVTLCPPATFGPLRHSISRIEDLNESNDRLWKYCFDSTEDAPMPYIPVHTYVDVRDLAKVQVQSMIVPEAANQRFIVCARQFSYQDICDILRSHFPELRKRTPLGRPSISSLPQGAYSVDNTKVREILGIEFRSLEETVLDTARYMLHVEQDENRTV
ncbi:flavonol reductase [Annulohypoxylon maeteangense]|uniref:flavonol reductase n=1 Tax=Annulohypoxylon maeteangense TaxID=1927788 RepID=UPI0020082FED|nr:flavonol reductase [Annulohypoxylon maeteangense]KAI0888180.1 flavonol reductase [Annulohypoxylon maeteangense]